MHVFINNITLLICLLIASLSLVIYLCSKFNNKLIDYILLGCVFVVYCVFIFSRTGLGVDEHTYLTYYKLYLNSSYFESSFGLKIVFDLFNILGITSENFNNSICLLFLTLSVLTIIYTIRSNNKAISLLFLLFSYTSIDLAFNAYRQAFSLLFFIMAITAYEKGYKYKSSLFYFSSILFHWAVIITIPFYILSKFLSNKYNKKALFIINIIVVLLLFFKPGFILFISDLFNGIPFDFELKSKISVYLSTSADNGFYNLNFNGRSLLIVSILSLTSFLYIFFNNIKENRLITFVIVYLCFCLFLIEMAFSFRNFYWILPFLFVFINTFIENRGVLSRSNKYLISICFFNVICLPIFFSSGLFPYLFK